MARRLSQRTRQEFRRVSRKIGRLGRNLDFASTRTVRMIGEDIMLDAKASRPGKGVPVREGTLRGTGRVESGPVPRAVTLSFGGASAPYALAQHENTEYQHTTGEPRYLIRAMERWRPNGVSAARARAELQREIDKLAIKRGGGRARDARGRFI